MAYEEAEPKKASVEDKYYKMASAHREYVEVHLKTIENLENQLDHNRRMLDIHRTAADAFQSLGHRAKDSMAEHREFLKRHEPQAAEPIKDVPRNY